MQKKLSKNITLILPVSGKSSRFKDSDPKWILSSPSGKLMIQEAIVELDLKYVNKILIICLKQHINKYIKLSSVKTAISEIVGKKISVEVCILSKPTTSQAHTIYNGIKKNKITGPIFIKDCDNQFQHTIKFGNNIATLNLDNAGLIEAKNKSFVEINQKYEVLRIVEKKVISNHFCTGGYGFSSAAEFNKYFEKIFKNKLQSGEIYVSHIIHHMIIHNEIFVSNEVCNYIDFGNLEEWQKYQNRYLTLICNLDGIIYKKSSKYLRDGWTDEINYKNVLALSNFMKEKKIYLVIFTSRPKDQENKIKKHLRDLGIRVNSFVFDIQLSSICLISNFEGATAYPSSSAINLPSDSDNLSSYLKNLSNY